MANFVVNGELCCQWRTLLSMANFVELPQKPFLDGLITAFSLAFDPQALPIPLHRELIINQSSSQSYKKYFQRPYSWGLKENQEEEKQMNRKAESINPIFPM
jgi:hypothetical protein